MVEDEPLRDLTISGSSQSRDVRSPPSTKKASTACLSCKKSKRKCSGGPPPCAPCIQRKLECVFDLGRDKRRKVAVKRTHDELEYHKDLLQGLMATIRSSKTASTDRLIDLIRQDASLEDVAAFVDEVQETLREQGRQHSEESAELEEWRANLSRRQHSRSPSEPRRKALNLSDICDDPPFRVPARPWTTVSDDDELISHLVSLYMTWEQPFLHLFVERNSFLRDMNAEFRPSNLGFCSPLLVNAMCAMACLISDRVGVEYSPHGSQSLGDKFFSEARRLFELELGKGSLVNVQALILMYLREGASGRDRAATMYRYLACEMCKRLEPWQKALSTSPKEENSAERDVISFIAWGIFCCESLVSWVYGHPSLVIMPSMDKTWAQKGSEQFGNDQWTPYPTIRPSRSCHSAQVLQEFSFLSEIMYEIRSYEQSGDIVVGSQQDVETRVDIYEKLLNWDADLPAPLSLQPDSLPNIYHLRTYYYMSLMAILRPLQALPFLQLPKDLGSPKDLCFKYSKQAMSNAELFEKLYPLKSSMNTCTPYLCAFTLILRLNEDTDTQEYFTQACRILRKIQGNFPAMGLVLEGLQAFAKFYNVHTPDDAEQYFEGHGFDKSAVQDIPVSFVLPSQDEMRDLLLGDKAAASSGPPRVHVESIGDLISQWRTMSLDEDARNKEG
ncbi:MAG: hypothetical protein M4579_006352 [Chaenotheca gracillima]|nr:MAG: hypothetical protein M4579_006352 [Chaenotheca gracillima]